ncbi:MAG: hypothetical protein K6G78_04115 [bacterium]|nr:hypothetical protein [bacterium]
MIWRSDKDGNVHFNGIDEVTIVYPAEVAPECGFIVSIDGAAVPAEDITIDESGYDASYEDYFTGDVVECIIPLATVKVSFGVESVEITLDDSYDAYQSYIYTAEPGDSGYTEYVDMGFGENAEVGGMETVLAYADTAYPTDVLPVSQVYRIQTAYDPETWASDNLHAIAFAPTAAPGWHKDASGEWYCFDADDDLITDGWAKDSKGWMYMASNGKITKNKWAKDGGSWYYLKSNGYMATGTLTINGKTYRFASNGKWIS